MQLHRRLVQCFEDKLGVVENGSDDFLGSFAFGMGHFDAGAEIAPRIHVVGIKDFLMLFLGFFGVGGIAEVDFIGEAFTRGKVFHEREISVPV